MRLRTPIRIIRYSNPIMVELSVGILIFMIGITQLIFDCFHSPMFDPFTYYLPYPTIGISLVVLGTGSIIATVFNISRVRCQFTQLFFGFWVGMTMFFLFSNINTDIKALFVTFCSWQSVVNGWLRLRVKNQVIVSLYGPTQGHPPSYSFPDRNDRSSNSTQIGRSPTESPIIYSAADASSQCYVSGSAESER